MLSGFDQLTKGSLILRSKINLSQSIHLKYILYSLVNLSHSPAELCKGNNSRKKLFNFLFVPQTKFYGGGMSLKNLIARIVAE